MPESRPQTQKKDARTEGLLALSELPALSLTSAYPTPLVPAHRLQARLCPDGPSIWMKRDDETGFGLGGNKVRKLETELHPSRLDGVTHLITCGGPQSNHARITAAAAASLGLSCVLVLNGSGPEPPTGNALLHRLFGARIVTVVEGSERDPMMALLAEEIVEAGGTPVVIPLGASTARGALGYARAAVEFDRQCPAGEVEGTTWIVIATSSCGTLGGLLAGFHLLGRRDVRLLGVSADVSRETILRASVSLARGALEVLGVESSLGRESLEASDNEVGDGYGIPTDAAREAIGLWAQHEGIVLDPVYTSKAAAGLITAVRSGQFTPLDRVVFWHTGGHPALFR